ncbi:hypothetical protein H0H93_009613 [Arthromyces matolae]|nr:hypothetical protein H0H93_009613 [Arthromyces matolae]
MTLSYQLPDLLSFCRPFELRSNAFCRPASLASESWLMALKKSDCTDSDVLTTVERDSLHPAKFGLLAALFISILSISDARTKAALTSIDQTAGRGLWSDEVHDQDDGVVILSKHLLFQYFLPELKRLVVKAKSSWSARFTSSVHSYHSAHLELLSCHTRDVIPTIETYIPMRRDLSGFRMLLDLFELTENLTLPSMDEETLNKFTHLRNLAIDIICCSLDVLAFNNDQVQGNRHNLITILMTQERLSLQGAVNLAGTMIKQKFDDFSQTEMSLFRPPTPPQANHSRITTLYSPWSWFNSAHLPTASSSDSLTPNIEQGADVAQLHLGEGGGGGDLPSYIQTLKDCIVGTINWAYETELYFGRKGEEIRTFGWVFLNSTVDSQEV